MSETTDDPALEVEVELPPDGATPEPEQQDDAAEKRFVGKAAKRAIHLRQRARAAEDRANAMEARARDLERQLAATTARGATSDAEVARNAIAAAQAALKQAQFDGDHDAAAKALVEISDAQITLRETQRAKEQAEARAQQVQQQPAAPQTSEAMRSWLDDNPWFQSDEAMNTAAMGFHKAAVRKGLAPESPEYFKHIDSSMRRAFPDEFDDDTADEVREIEPEVKPAAKQAPAPSAPAAPRRNTQASTPSTRSVRLTPLQRERADALGVTEQEYAAVVARRLAKERAI